MPKFYFDVREIDGTITHDEFGLDLPSEEVALDQANRTLAEISSEEIRDNKSFRLRIRVRDEAGKEVVCRRAQVSSDGFDEPHGSDDPS